MNSSGKRRNWAVGIVVTSAAWLASPDANACSCAGGATLEWPAADQTGVPLDTSIVVSGFGSFATSQLSLVVPPKEDAGAAPPKPAAMDGGVSEPLPLPPSDEPEHPAGLHLVSPNRGIVLLAEGVQYPSPGCTFTYRFYQLEAGQLEANTTYRLFEGASFVAAFTTGTQRRDLDAEVAAAKAVHFETLGTTENPPRVTTAFVGNVPSTLAFVHYAGSDEEVTYRMYNRASAEGVTTYDLGIVRCPTVKILDMDGAVLDRRELCEPERCKVHPDAVSRTSCGGNYSVGVGYREFGTLPACTAEGADGGSSPASTVPLPSTSNAASDDSAPTASTTSEAVNDDEPGPNKVPLSPQSSSDAGGCSVGEAHDRSATWGWLVGLVGFGAIVRRRRG
jgi:MYXO-CTERM domain-containing protein